MKESSSPVGGFIAGERARAAKKTDVKKRSTGMLVLLDKSFLLFFIIITSGELQAPSNVRLNLKCNKFSLKLEYREEKGGP